MQKAALGSPFKFTRTHRLAAKQDIDAVFAKPKRVSVKFLLALYRPNQLPYARLAVMLSKAHARRAVDRNYLRRLIRECFRSHLPVLAGVDVVVMLRSRCSIAERATWRDKVRQLWQTVVEEA